MPLVARMTPLEPTDMPVSQLLGLGLSVVDERYPPANADVPEVMLLRPTYPAVAGAVPVVVATAVRSLLVTLNMRANRAGTAVPRSAARTHRTRRAVAADRPLPVTTANVPPLQVPKSTSVAGSTTTAVPSAVVSRAAVTMAFCTTVGSDPNRPAPARADASAAPCSCVLTTRTCDTSTASVVRPVTATMAIMQ